MIDIEKLEALAKAATVGDKKATTPIAELIGAMDAFRAETGPSVVLELIAELKETRKDKACVDWLDEQGPWGHFRNVRHAFEVSMEGK